MSSTVQFFRENPGAMVMAMLVALGTLVFGLVALIMARSGASLRPIVFIAGFFAIVVLPQALFHFSQAFGWIPKQSLTWVPEGNARASSWHAREELLAMKDGRFAQPKLVYGNSVDVDLVSDLRTRLTNVFGNASAAEMAILKTGGSVVLAQFNSASDAETATHAYATAMLGTVPAVDNDGVRTVTRANDVVKLVVAGRTMVAYSAADAASANKLLAESPIVARGQATTASVTPPQEKFWLYRVTTLVPLTLLLLFVAVFWFFRMSMWASEVLPPTNVEPAAASTLRERLLSVNALDVPFSVAVSPDDASTMVVTWRYADAKWLDLARAHGMKRMHRMVLHLDEANRTVRPTDQTSAMDWDAAKNGASVRWASQVGIVFFQHEQQRVFGLQLDSLNRFTPKLSYSYKFNLQEMKAPFIQAVTQSGWKWRPTLLHGPKWISWLTQ